MALPAAVQRLRPKQQPPLSIEGGRPRFDSEPVDPSAHARSAARTSSCCYRGFRRLVNSHAPTPRRNCFAAHHGSIVREIDRIAA